MYIKNLITNLFNLEVESIEDIEVSNEYGRTFVYITLKKVPSVCPHCGTVTTLVNDYRTRCINHSILTDRETELIYHQRRMMCPKCNRSFAEKNPFVATGRRVSHFTVIHIMEMLRDPRTTFSMVSRATGLSIPTVQRIFDEHAGIRTKPFPRVLCIDEIYSVKHKQRVYSCVLADFETSSLYDLLPSRHKTDLYSYFSRIPEKTRNKVRYVSMDMWEPYRDAAGFFFRNARICVDSFHVIALISRAFDSIRKSVMNNFGKGSDEYYLLKKYHWMLYSSYEDMDMSKEVFLYRDTCYRSRGYIGRRNLLNLLLDLDPLLEVGYVIKEGYLTLNRHATIDDVEVKLNSWLTYADASGIPEFMSVVKTIKKWRQEIINSFNRIDGRRISNGPVESVNSRLDMLKSSANGYSVFERFRLRALYSLDKASTIKD